MLNKRQKDIVKILEEARDFVTVQTISDNCGLSKRTIHSELRIISEYLLQQGKCLEKRRGVGVAIKHQSASSVGRKLQEDKVAQVNDILERRLKIMRCLLFEPSPLTYQSLSNTFLVSKTSIANDFEYVLSILDKDNTLHLAGERQGTHLQASEAAFQTAMLRFNRFVMEHSEIHSQEMLPQNMDSLTQYYGGEIIKTCQHIFYSYLRENINVISDHYVQNVLNSLIILVYRSSKGYHHELSEEISEKFFEESASRILDKVTLRLGVQFTQGDKIFFSKQLVLNRFEKLSSNLQFETFLHQLIESMSLSLKVDFSADKKLKEQLAEHIPAMMYRLQSNVSVENPFTDQIKREFTLIFNLLSMLIVENEKEYQVVFNENEIAFLTIYFQSAIERAKINKRILVVCQMGIATSELLLNRIKQTLPSLDTLELSSIAELDYLDLNQYDFIISTVHLDIPEPTVIRVSPFLTEKDIENIKAAGYSPSMATYGQSVAQFHHLYEFLSEESIFLDTNFKDKEQFFKEFGQNLVDKEIVQPEFIDDLFHREKLGSTDLPMGVAIPHGNPQNILKSQIFLLRNQKKMKWNEYFVDIMFVICIHKNDALRTRGILSDIYNIIDNPQLLKFIRQAKQGQQLLEELYGGSQNG